MTLGNKIKIADEYWKSNRLSQAIRQYKMIIDKESFLMNIRSLVYLRLAEAQFQAKLPEDCRMTLSKAKTLIVLPAHHKLKIEELEKKLNGVPLNERIPIPANPKAIATFYISSIQSGEKINSTNKVELNCDYRKSTFSTYDPAGILPSSRNTPNQRSFAPCIIFSSNIHKPTVKYIFHM